LYEIRNEIRKEIADVTGPDANALLLQIHTTKKGTWVAFDRFFNPNAVIVGCSTVH
jgi:hypothetical protein